MSSVWLLWEEELAVDEVRFEEMEEPFVVSSAWVVGVEVGAESLLGDYAEVPFGAFDAC